MHKWLQNNYKRLNLLYLLSDAKKKKKERKNNSYTHRYTKSLVTYAASFVFTPAI